MIRFLLVMLSVFSLSPVWAGGFAVVGVVTDSVGTPEPYATLWVGSENANPLLGVADEEGAFKVQLPQAGDYMLLVSAVGKENLMKAFSVSEAEPVADLGKVAMGSDAHMLGEVTVTAARPVVVREIDRIAYDVTADPDAEANPLSEILSKVPLVNVEPDGTVKVRGTSEFKIYKNGRPNETLNKNHKDIFKSIPASSISKIEVITDPGVREDAEGASVILNIVTTRKVTFKGVTGTIGLNTTNAHDFVPQPNAYLTTQIGNVTMSFNGGNSYAPTKTWQPSHSWGTRIYDQTGNVSKTDSYTKMRSVNNYGSLEMSWEPDTLNLLNVDLGGYYYVSTTHNWGTTEMLDPQGNLLYSYAANSCTHPQHSRGFWGSANYQRSTRLKGETVTLSYRISDMWDNSTDTASYTDRVNFPVAYDRSIQGSRTNFLEQTVQADWNRPMGQKFILNLGAKGIFRRQSSKGTLDYVPVSTEHTDFRHSYDIMAAYADLQFHFGRMGGRAGVRYEYSYLKAEFRDGSNPDFSKHLNDWVPNAALIWNATDRYSVKMGYSTSISRPGIMSLNPLRVETPNSVSYGNPGLGSSWHQNLNMTQSFFTPTLNLELTASYNFCNNAVANWIWTDDGVTYHTSANRGRRRNFYLSLWGGWNITKKLYLSGTFSAARTYSSLGPGELDYSAWSFYNNLSVRYQLPWAFSMRVWTNISPSSSTMYNEISNRYDGAWLSYGLSVQRQFLKDDRLTVMLRWINPFMHGYRLVKFTPRNAGYTGQEWSQSETNRFFGISLSYRFGSLRAQVKKTAATINNTDDKGIGK